MKPDLDNLFQEQADRIIEAISNAPDDQVNALYAALGLPEQLPTALLAETWQTRTAGDNSGINELWSAARDLLSIKIRDAHYQHGHLVDLRDELKSRLREIRQLSSTIQDDYRLLTKKRLEYARKLEWWSRKAEGSNSVPVSIALRISAYEGILTNIDKDLNEIPPWQAKLADAEEKLLQRLEDVADELKYSAGVKSEQPAVHVNGFYRRLA